MTVLFDDGLKLAREAITDLEKHVEVLDYHVGGSCWITSAGNDVDVIVLVKDLEFGKLSLIYTHLGEESYASDGDFDSYRHGDVNFILCSDPDYYRRWLHARDVCRFLYMKRGLSDRDTRVAVHHIVVDQEAYNE